MHREMVMHGVDSCRWLKRTELESLTALSANLGGTHVANSVVIFAFGLSSCPERPSSDYPETRSSQTG